MDQQVAAGTQCSANAPVGIGDSSKHLYREACRQHTKQGIIDRGYQETQ